MSKRNNIKPIAIALIVLLSVWGVLKLKESKQGDRSFKSEVVAVDTSLVKTITIFPKQSAEKALICKEQGLWMIDLENKKVQADQGTVHDLLSQLVSVKTKSVAATDKSKWESYELTDSMSSRIIVNENSKPLADIRVGKFTFNQQKRSMVSYVRNTDEEEIYAVDGYMSMMFNRGAQSYRANSILVGEPQNWKKLVFSYPADSSFTLEKQSDKWLVNGVLADSIKVQEYFSRIRILSDNNFDDESSIENSQAFCKLTLEGNNFSPITIAAFDKNGQWLISSSQNKGNLFSSLKAKDVLFVNKEDFWLE